VIEFFSRGINEPNGEVSALFATVGGQLAQYLERRSHERDEDRRPLDDDRLRRMLEATGAHVAVLDADGCVRLAGASTCAALRLAEADVIGRAWPEFVPEAAREAVAAALASVNGSAATVEHPLGDADPRPVRWRLARVEGDEPLFLLTGEPPAAPATDRATGLADRAALEAGAEDAIERAVTTGGDVSVVQLDVEDVRLVNDSLGVAAGDALLRELAARLAGALPEATLLARSGGDALVALLDGVDGGNAQRRAEVALAALAEPVELDGTSVRVSASAGIAAYPEDAACATELIARADRATHRAKQVRRGSWAAYTPGDTGRLDTLSTAAGLHRALERGELELYWQPIYGLGTGSLVGLEALVRWNHPERGLVPPALFIPVAEQTGVIEALGDWVVGAVCAQQVEWAERGLHPLLSFNVSPTQLRAADFTARVAEHLRSSGADPGRLTVELTESSTLEDPARAEPLVRELHELGLRIALDDFGSGYSSLSRLREMPVATLKIDRAFMRDVPERPEAAAVVTAILQLARALGRTAIAEGVETEAQRAFLAEQGCPLAQGFLFGHPVPAAEAEALMASLTA
jgi:diguanylate cyclase (GGDEF)-like protein